MLSWLDFMFTYVSSRLWSYQAAIFDFGFTLWNIMLFWIVFPFPAKYAPTNNSTCLEGLMFPDSLAYVPVYYSHFMRVRVICIEIFHGLWLCESPWKGAIWSRYVSGTKQHHGRIFLYAHRKMGCIMLYHCPSVCLSVTLVSVRYFKKFYSYQLHTWYIAFPWALERTLFILGL